MDTIVLTLCIIFTIAAVVYFFILLPDIIRWWRENFRKMTFTGRLLRFIVDIPFYIYAVLYFVCKFFWLVIQFLLIAGLFIGIPFSIISTIYEQILEPSPGFIILSILATIFVLYIAYGFIYNKVYGNAKEATKRILIELNKTNDLYQRLGYSLKLLNRNPYHTREVLNTIDYIKGITESLTALRELYADKSLSKYISEDDSKMKFKKIEDEIKHLDELLNEIKTTYYGSAKLILPTVNTRIQESTDTVYYIIKCRRRSEKRRFNEYPAKVERTKILKYSTDENGVVLAQEESIRYTILDFYFFKHRQRKPFVIDAANQFESFGQKSYLTSIQDNGVPDVFEVILTGDDATSEYRKQLEFDTVRKLAKNSALAEQIKKAIKGIKISYTPPNSKQPKE